MTKLNIGVGDDFPVNDAAESIGATCERVRAYWAARRKARRERWRQWCHQWHATCGDSKPKAQTGDASYTDVPLHTEGKA